MSVEGLFPSGGAGKFREGFVVRTLNPNPYRPHSTEAEPR